MSRRIESAAFAATLVAATFYANCYNGGSSHPNNPPPGIESLQQPMIDLRRIPSHLPDAVAAQLETVVHIAISKEKERFIGDGFSTSLFDNHSYLSGVKIGPNLVLTAGHALRDTNGNLNTTVNCGDLYITGSTDASGLSGYRANTVTSEVSSFNERDSVPDIALLVTGAFSGFDDLKSAQISPLPPRIGDVVYFVNFQPDSLGNERDPGVYENRLNRPAVFPGIVVGTTKTGALQVITGLVSYSQGEPDTRARRGASGGAVFNEFGELVAISSRVSNLLQTASQIAELFGVEINYPLSDARFELDEPQPIPPGLIAGLVNQLDSSLTSCVPTPPASIIYLG